MKTYRSVKYENTVTDDDDDGRMRSENAGSANCCKFFVTYTRPKLSSSDSTRFETIALVICVSIYVSLHLSVLAPQDDDVRWKQAAEAIISATNLLDSCRSSRILRSSGSVHHPPALSQCPVAALTFSNYRSAALLTAR